MSAFDFAPSSDERFAAAYDWQVGWGGGYLFDATSQPHLSSRQKQE